jgi:hypothetical protein
VHGLKLLLCCMLPLQVLKAPHFNIGHIGSMGRGKCHAEMSADARFVAAGAADGQVRRNWLVYAAGCCQCITLPFHGVVDGICACHAKFASPASSPSTVCSTYTCTGYQVFMPCFSQP